MFTIPVAIINESVLVRHSDVLAAAAAIQVQIHRDFAPAWNIDADVAVVPQGERPPTGTCWIVVMDNSDLGTALGYHDLTNQGLPLGKVFVEVAQKEGQEWTNILSHEILEMLSDPFIYLTALWPTAHGIYQYAYENCDACQSVDFGYRIDGQLVSNFCLPSWFDANQIGGVGPFDFGKHIRQPFALLPGGFALRRNLSIAQGWTLVAGPGPQPTYNMRPRIGSRRERRKTECQNWTKSPVWARDGFPRTSSSRPILGVSE
jgi:hypothetical protein